MMRSARFPPACALAATLIAATVTAQAQSPSPPQSASPKPTPAPAELSVQTRSALKLAGLVAFVANACADLKPDYARFEQALGALGVTTSDLAKADMRSAYLAYAARYNADTKASCLRAKAQFGPGGSTLPDIFALR